MIQTPNPAGWQTGARINGRRGLRLLGKFTQVLLIGVLMSAPVVWADCQTTYNQAMTLLDTTTTKAVQNGHPNPDAFSSEFQSLVGSLQAQKCLPELMTLIQHIQSEQQKIPNPTDAASKGLPITN